MSTLTVRQCVLNDVVETKLRRRWRGRRTECRARKADEHTAGNGSRMPVRRGRVTRRCTPWTVGSRLSSRQADENTEGRTRGRHL
jgi:hypothetical protein